MGKNKSHKNDNPKQRRIQQCVGTGKGNRPPDVRLVQCLLNIDRNRQAAGTTAPLLKISGKLDKETQDAINLFQTTAVGIAEPGRISPGDATITALWSALPALPTTDYETPAWLAKAKKEEKDKVAEVADGKTPDYSTNNPRVLAYLDSFAGLAKSEYKVAGKDEAGHKLKDAKGRPIMVGTGHMMNTVEDTPWCAAFVNWCLKEAGITPRGPDARAKSWREWGTYAAGNPAGAICVIEREPFGDSGSGFHIGFLVQGRAEDGYVALLGGNQDNKVCIKWFVGIEPKKITTRWPPGA
jgi:uncharacterized protein (TIGR02594 family)